MSLPPQTPNVGDLWAGRQFVGYTPNGQPIWKSANLVPPSAIWNGQGQILINGNVTAEIPNSLNIKAGETVAFSQSVKGIVRGAGSGGDHELNYGTWRLLGCHTAPWDVRSAELVRVA